MSNKSLLDNSTKNSAAFLEKTLIYDDHKTAIEEARFTEDDNTVSDFEETLIHADEQSDAIDEKQKRKNHLLSIDSRYHTEDVLGVGGFAIVHKVFDKKVGRQVALKSIDSSASNEMLSMSFNLEARVMSQLDHPGILPVYDVIENEDESSSSGSASVKAYSMRIASHASLYEYLLETPTLDIHKLCHNLKQVALTLEHAHQRGVLHRDIKPHNILLGSEGEVYLTDWGICLLLPEHQDYTLMSEAYKSAFVGTPAYMAPEQAAQQTIDARTDVFGLGTCLYFALTGKAPISGDSLQQVLEKAGQVEIITPSDVWKERGIEFPYPQALEAICLKCLNKDPQKRYQSARALAQALESFTNGELERERLKEAAHKAYQQGKLAYQDFLSLFDEQHKLIQLVNAASVGYKKSRSEEDRKNKWSLEAELDALLIPLEENFTKAVSTFRSALRANPSHEEARRAITRLYKVRYERALGLSDHAMSIFFESRIREFATEEDLNLLDQPSKIILQGLPKKVEVIVYKSHLKRYETKLEQYLKVENYQGDAIYLERGRYLIELKHQGASLVRIPLWIKNFQVLNINTPLPKKSAIPNGFVYIKDGLAFSECPTSMKEYCDFLNDISLEEADQRIPRYHQTPYCFRADNGRFDLPYKDLEGDTWQAEWPVMLISYHDSIAYTKWLSNKLNVKARLPDKDEWLEAASGGDGRVYPWGNSFDASLCTMRESHNGRPVPTSLKMTKKDRSPYGINHVAGNICQWANTPIPGLPKHKYMMGASYNSQEVMCRLDHTMQAHEDETFVHLGIRVVIELDDQDFLPSAH